MSNDQEISGYSNLRIGFVLTSLSEIILFVALIIILNEVFQLISKIPPSNLSSLNASSISSSELGSLLSSISSTIGIEVLGIVLGVIASIFLYIGFNKEKGFYNIGNATTGAILVLIGFILYALFSIIGVILGIIGFILMKGALDSIGNKYNENLVNIGAILSIIPIISIIGTVIVAVGLTKVINRAKSGQITLTQPLSPTSVSQPIQQIGLGVIKENGEISLTLYSQVQATITSVRIEGTSYFSTLSIPLQIGNNNIIINLGMPISLVKATTYKITLMVSTPSGTLPVSVDALYNP